MLLTIESDHPEMSFLLHKHPARLHSQPISFGLAHAFYPRPTKVALLIEIDPLSLTRRGGADTFALKPYVNDRSYVAGSFLSVALNQMFRTAVAARCNKRPELISTPMKLEAVIPTLPVRGGDRLLRSLFEPLGYQVEARRLPLDEKFPDWGDSAYFHCKLKIVSPLFTLLRHLYILLPVLDNEKHYWVGEGEIEKLLENGQQWLAEHPLCELIVSRYLKHQKGLARQALDVLASDDSPRDQEAEETVEEKLGLHQQRLEAVVEVLLKSGAVRVADLGCGEGKLLRRLLKHPQFSQILAMDVSMDPLRRAGQSLERQHESKRQRVELFQGSLLYTDPRLQEVEAACLVEVIEHLEPDRLSRVAHNLFHRIRPRTLVITTPNREYNALWESLPAGNFRHPDHRFEWTRQEFATWAHSVKHDYQVSLQGLGEAHPEHGSPSQMAVFRR